MTEDPLKKYETSTLPPARTRIKNAGAALTTKKNRLGLILLAILILAAGAIILMIRR